MLLDAQGNPIPESPIALVDPVYDPDNEAGPYVLPNVRTDSLTPELREALSNEIERARMDAGNDSARLANLDAFANELTGLGTVQWDKTRGGMPGGPFFVLNRVRHAEAEALARGSDLGGNIVNKIPDEMTREGWKVEIQPTDEDEDIAVDRQAFLDACITQPHRAAAAWRREAQGRSRQDAARCYALARRWDAWPSQQPGEPRPTNGAALPHASTPPSMGATAPLPPPPGPLPKLNDEGIEIARVVEKWGESVEIEKTFNLALRYERNFGGGAIFIGVDDGGMPLSSPLDPEKVRKVTHLTPLSGGWDGEVVMWRPYNDMTHPKYGKPWIYQMRNLAVSLGRPPAPGEGPVQQLISKGPAGPTIFYVHESRFVIFNGDPTTRQVEQEMRGWGDSIFTKAKEVLSQYDQTWNAVCALMQEFSIVNMGIKGYSVLLASKKQEDRDILIRRARELQLMRSVARMNVYDLEDKVERMGVSLTGVPELLDGPLARRLAATADEPVSILFGQVIGSIGGGAGESERASWHNTIRSKQNRKLVPALTRLYELLFRSKEGPTKGVVPDRWSVVPNPLWQLTPVEQADVRLKTTQADAVEIEKQVVTPEEVTATRYGSAEYNPGPIVIDLDGRAKVAESEAQRAQERMKAAQVAPTDPNEGAAPGNALAPKESVTQEVFADVPPMTAMPTDPITATPTAVPSVVGETGDDSSNESEKTPDDFEPPAPISNLDAAESEESEEWVTINGTHVLLGSGGKISEGPENIRGKKLGSAKSTKPGHAAPTKAPKASHQPNQHETPAQAARKASILKESTPATEAPHYHGTSVEALQSILTHGIKPTDTTMGIKTAWAGTGENIAHSYAAGAAAAKNSNQYAMITIGNGKDSGLLNFRGNKSAAFSTSAISPSNISRIQIFRVGAKKNEGPIRTIEKSELSAYAKELSGK